MKRRLLFASVSLMLMLILNVFHAYSWCQEKAFELELLEVHRQQSELAAVARAEEQRLIGEGTLWRDELYTEGSNPVNAEPQKLRTAADSVCHRRIAGQLQNRNSSMTARYEMHECHPGSLTCTTGGIIYIESANRPICSISLNLLRCDTDARLRSTFCVHWLNTSLNECERIEVLTEMAGPEVLPDAPTLGQLLRSAYRDSSENTLVSMSPMPSHRALLGKILRGIIEARSACGRSLNEN